MDATPGMAISAGGYRDVAAMAHANRPARDTGNWPLEAGAVRPTFPDVAGHRPMPDPDYSRPTPAQRLEREMSV